MQQVYSITYRVWDDTSLGAAVSATVLASSMRQACERIRSHKAHVEMEIVAISLVATLTL